MATAEEQALRDAIIAENKAISQASRLVCDPEVVELRVDANDPDAERLIEVYPGRSMTRQSDADGADINKILDRMSAQGVGLVLNPLEPRFLDISDVGDYRTCISQVREARSYFMQLDAEDRARFNNRVENFLDAVTDPVKLAALIAEGVVVDGSIVGGPPVAPGGVAPVAPTS